MRRDLCDFKAEIFKALSHPTRVAIIELLYKERELPVTRIHEQLGLEQTNVSQHLSVLRDKHLVTGRKHGNQVYYFLRHPVLGEVLDLLRHYCHAHLKEALGLLEKMQLDGERRE